ncbi:MAG: hypothetical protein U5R31_13450 [Acidimicrobiia bacterium]|nr:hypothetical protein [Acidimicrobiia bacterium]
MTKESDLVAAAERALGTDEEVLAAGVFGLQDDLGAIAVAGVTTDLAADAAGISGTVADAAIGAGTLHATRAAVARSEGVSVRMLVAVTERRIHVWAWEGGEAGRELMTFDRASTAVQITKFGLSRHLNLADDERGMRLGLTGSTAFFSPESAGDKLVLHLLSDSSG